LQLQGSREWPEEVVSLACSAPSSGDGLSASSMAVVVVPQQRLGYCHEGCEVTLEALEEAVATKAREESLGEGGRAITTPMTEHAGDNAPNEPQDEEVSDKAAEEAAARRERAREQWLAQDRVRTFLAKHGFTGVCARRRRLLSTDYPLHCAVKLRDAEMVELLLQFKADPQQENSAGLTPQQCALELARSGSHAEVMMALSKRAP